MKKIIENAKQAIGVTLVMFVVCGLFYPLAMTGFAQTLFKEQANGSMVEADGKVVGSALIGQAFTSPYYFQGRVSAIHYNVYTPEDEAYSGISSGTFNYAPSNPELINRIEEDVEAFLKANPTVKREEIPADLITASGSGLDPHISLEAANIQINRIAQASDLSIDEVKEIMKANTEGRPLGIFGEEKMNVLTANLDIYRKMNER